MTSCLSPQEAPFAPTQSLQTQPQCRCPCVPTGPDPSKAVLPVVIYAQSASPRRSGAIGCGIAVSCPAALTLKGVLHIVRAIKRLIHGDESSAWQCNQARCDPLEAAE